MRLSPIIITATRTPTPVEQIGSAVSVLTGEELERRQIRIVSDALRDVPGVSVNRSGGVGAVTQLRLRGAEANQTLVLIDGIEVNDPANSSEFDFANLLALGIDRIEILRGPQSALYGSDAVGGVVNIITKNGEGPSGASASIEGGSFRTGRASASGSFSTQRVRAFLAGQAYHTDGVSSASKWRGNGESDGYDNLSAVARLGADVTDFLQLDAVARLTDARIDTDNFVGGVGAIDADQESDILQRFGRLQAKLEMLDGRWTHVVGASAAETERKNFVNDAFDSRSTGRKTKLDYQTNLSFSLGKTAHTVTGGLEREDERLKSLSAFVDVDRSIETDSIFGQYQLGLFDRLFLTAGVRHDNNEIFDDATTYRFTAAYLFPESGTKLRGSYGTAVKNPTLFELFGFTPTFTGNPNLGPERLKGWDVGIDQSFLGKRVNLGVTYFDNRITDLITGAGVTAINVPGTSHIQGIEVEGRAELARGLDLALAYTYTYSRDAQGAELVRRPRHVASANLSYRFLADRAQVDLGVRYNGAQDDLAFDAFFNTSTVRLDAYTVVNVAASYTLTENFTLFGRVENLFNERYEDVFTFGAPGLAGYAGIRASF